MGRACLGCLRKSKEAIVAASRGNKEGSSRDEVRRETGKDHVGHVGHNKALILLWKWELFMVLSSRVYDLTF